MAAEVVAAASARGAPPDLQELLVEPTWREVLAAEFDKPNAKQLQRHLHRDWAEQKVFPPQAEIFRCCSTWPTYAAVSLTNTKRADACDPVLLAALTLVLCPCRAMNSCPFDAVEVVILGERPALSIACATLW